MLIVELQEPTDLSVLLEWDGFGIDGRGRGDLGLGWDVALGRVDLAALRPRAAARPDPTRDGPVTPLLPPAADAYFRAERLAPAPIAALERGFAILVVTDGAGTLLAEGGEPLPRAPRRHGARAVGGGPGATSRATSRRSRAARRTDGSAGGDATSLLGIDVGTSACKAAVVDADGAERAHGQAPTPWRQRRPPAPRSTPTRCSTPRSRPRRAALAAAPEGRSAGSA